MERVSSTLRQILVTTEQLAAEVGCQRVTMQEIMKRSGNSKGAIYHYVQSKDELFGLILQEHMNAKISEHQGRLAGAPHPEAGLSAATGRPHSAESGTVKAGDSHHRLGPIAAIIRGLLQPANEKQLVLRKCFIYLLSRQEQPDVAKILASLHQNWVDFTVMWIAACQRRGLIPSDIQPSQTSALIISILFGLMVQKSITENRGDEEAAAVDPHTVLSLISGMLKMGE